MTKVEEFLWHLEETKDEHLDAIDRGEEYDAKKFNIKISLNGKRHEVELHADSYMALIKLLETEEG